MADFKIADNITQGNEGRNVWSILPGDSGGETWSGIARNKHPDCAIWPLIDAMKPLNNGQKVTSPELEEIRLAFYKKYFWDPLDGDNIPYQGVANQSYDEAVNAGEGMGEKIMNESKPNI